MATRAECIQLARTLPPRLQRFFAKYPPPSILPTSAKPAPPPATPPSNPDAPAAKAISTTPAASVPNPFLPSKHPITGFWLDPRIGLRHQRQLCKIAEEYGVESLMPFSKKSTAYKEQRLAEYGLRVKGTGEGQKVKGHKWERTMRPRLEVRKKAMMEMPELIQKWRESGHGRRWKKWPK
ncbi:MAG: hypothetical protein M1834_007891 [Cirrosporium novae-zelandiae]|nr:MAG: hypothetical protein M1834_007891 [Cirrosporium novae-zelandiae]